MTSRSYGTNDSQPPKPPIHLSDWHEIMTPLPPLEYLVRDLTLVSGSGAPHMFAGYGASGKTMAVQSLLLSLAAGKAVWGAFPVQNDFRVLHIDYEQGEPTTFRRYQRLARGMRVEASVKVAQNLVCSCLPKTLTLNNLQRAAWVDLMAGRDLIVLDSYRVATGGGDENSSEIRNGLDMLTSISGDTGCRALVLHHARKQSANQEPGSGADRFSIRGSSAIFDACDSVFVFDGKANEPTLVRNEKARSHGEKVEEFYLTVVDVEGGGLKVKVDGAPELELVTQTARDEAQDSQVTKDASRIYKALLEAPGGLATEELKAAARVPGNRFKQALAELGNTVRTIPRILQGGGKAITYIVPDKDK